MGTRIPIQLKISISYVWEGTVYINLRKRVHDLIGRGNDESRVVAEE